MVLEFVGEGAEALSIDERLAVANMAVEAGSETGFFPADETVAAYLEGRTDRPWSRGALRPRCRGRAQAVQIDLDRLPPLVALPHSPGNVVPLGEAARAQDRPGLHRQLLERDDDRPAAGGRAAARPAGAAERTRAIIVPASQRVYREALAEGLLDVFVEAGAMVSTPTCGACFGGSGGVLGPGESAITTTNRNFRGRMGSSEAGVHLANAWVAAAAAVAGEIVDPAEVLGRAADPRGPRGRDPAGRRRHRRALPGPRILNITDVEQMTQYLFEGLDPSLRDQLGGRHGTRRRLELRRRLLARARPAGDGGVRHPLPRRQELRAHLLPQLHQPRPAGRDGAGGSSSAATPGSTARARSRGGQRSTVDGRAFPIDADPAVHARDVRARAVPRRRADCDTVIDATTPVG